MKKFQSKSSLTYGFRTGKDIVKGKRIRKHEDGTDDYDDYWTESEEESLESDKDLGKKTSKQNNAKANLPRGLRDNVNTVKGNKALKRKFRNVHDNSTGYRNNFSTPVKNPSERAKKQKLLAALTYGRRTRANVIEGREIRQHENGYHNYEDYWTESESSLASNKFRSESVASADPKNSERNDTTKEKKRKIQSVNLSKRSIYSSPGKHSKVHNKQFSVTDDENVESNDTVSLHSFKKSKKNLENVSIDSVASTNSNIRRASTKATPQEKASKNFEGTSNLGITSDLNNTKNKFRFVNNSKLTDSAVHQNTRSKSKNFTSGTMNLNESEHILSLHESDKQTPKKQSKMSNKNSSKNITIKNNSKNDFNKDPVDNSKLTVHAVYQNTGNKTKNVTSSTINLNESEDLSLDESNEQTPKKRSKVVSINSSKNITKSPKSKKKPSFQDIDEHAKIIQSRRSSISNYANVIRTAKHQTVHTDQNDSEIENLNCEDENEENLSYISNAHTPEKDPKKSPKKLSVSSVSRSPKAKRKIPSAFIDLNKNTNYNAVVQSLSSAQPLSTSNNVSTASKTLNDKVRQNVHLNYANDLQLPDVSVPENEKMVTRRSVTKNSTNVQKEKRLNIDDENSPETVNNERKSCRRRFPPLPHWRNVRAKYSYTRKGEITLIGIDEGTKEDNMHKLTMLKKYSKRKLGKRKEEEIKNVINVFNPESKKEVPFGSLMRSSSQTWHKESSEREDSEYYISRTFDSEDNSFGFLKIPYLKHKSLQYLPSDDVYFVILRGEIKVQIHKSVFSMKTNDSFLVPHGNAYAIYNIGSVAACLSFAVFKNTFQKSLLCSDV